MRHRRLIRAFLSPAAFAAALALFLDIGRKFGLEPRPQALLLGLRRSSQGRFSPAKKNSGRKFGVEPRPQACVAPPDRPVWLRHTGKVCGAGRREPGAGRFA